MSRLSYRSISSVLRAIKPIHQTINHSTTQSIRSFSSLPPQSRAVLFKEHGDPLKVLSIIDEKLPSHLSSGQVCIRFLASPINPSDINIIEGSYAVRPSLPAIAGSEGVAEVVSVADDVTGLQIGDRVIPGRAAFGTWRTHAIARADELARVDARLSVHQAATLAVNPCTAYRMMRDFTDLHEGDVIIQNGATSAVGRCVIGYAAKLGVKSVNIIRDRPNMEETINELHDAGATHVINEGAMNEPRTKQLLASLPRAKLALNCVGGLSSGLLAKQLQPAGVMVTYGGMSKRPLQIPTSLFIFNELRCEGFWMTRWNSQHSAAERDEMRNAVTELILDGSMHVPVEGVPFAEIERALRTLSERKSTSGKLVLEFDKE